MNSIDKNRYIQLGLKIAFADVFKIPPYKLLDFDDEV